MYTSHPVPASPRRPPDTSMYYSPTQSAMEHLLPRPVPVARPSLKGKYYSPTTTIQRLDSSSTLGGSLNSSPLTAHSPSGRHHFSNETGDGPFADSPPNLPPKEPQRKAVFPRPMAVGQPLRSSSSRDFASSPGVTQQYASYKQAPPRPLRTSSSRDVTLVNGSSPRSVSSREAMRHPPRSVSSRETMRHPPRSMSSGAMNYSPKGGPHDLALPRVAPRISPKVSTPEISNPFPRKMSMASQPSTTAAPTNGGTRVKHQEMTQPGRVETMSMTKRSADVKGTSQSALRTSCCTQISICNANEVHRHTKRTQKTQLLSSGLFRLLLLHLRHRSLLVRSLNHTSFINAVLILASCFACVALVYEAKEF